MFCKRCGTENRDDMLFCKECGAPLQGQGGAKSSNAASGAGNSGNDTPIQPKSQPNYQQQNYQQQAQANYQQPQSQVVYHQQPPVQTVYAGFDENNIPEEYKPISMWGYFGYELLFAIPLVGFIVLLVFAFGGTRNKNLKNFARSYFCAMIVAVIIIVILAFVLGGLGYAIGSSGPRYHW